jgi:hypothetical protein
MPRRTQPAVVTTDETPRDPVRDSPGYRRERARLEARRHQDPDVEQERPDPIEEWIEFGKHHWLWQLCHRKPS